MAALGTSRSSTPVAGRAGATDISAPGAPETFRVGSDENDQQHGPDEMATGKNRNLETLSFRRPPHKHALEITLLRFMDSEMHLCKRARKNQRHPRSQTNNGQLQRGDEIDNFAQHIPKTHL